MDEDEVLPADPRVAAVPVEDCGEDLVSLLDDDRFLVDRRKADDHGHWARVRSGLLAQLWLAEKYLRERGHRLLFVEGYRPLSLQREYWEEYLGQLRQDHPDWLPEQLRAMASRYVSPPEIAPHSCGGAVDVTLADANGQELDLGCRVNATPEESNNLCYLHADGLTEQARSLRSLLLNAMRTGGFSPLVSEFWHYELGTMRAALLSGKSVAWYGPLDDQPTSAEVPSPAGGAR